MVNRWTYTNTWLAFRISNWRKINVVQQHLYAIAPCGTLLRIAKTLYIMPPLLWLGSDAALRIKSISRSPISFSGSGFITKYSRRKWRQMPRAVGCLPGRWLRAQTACRTQDAWRIIFRIRLHCDDWHLRPALRTIALLNNLPFTSILLKVRIVQPGPVNWGHNAQQWLYPQSHTPAPAHHFSPCLLFRLLTVFNPKNGPRA